MNWPSTLTPLQITKLSDSGIQSLYELITYLPSRNSELRRLSSHTDSPGHMVATGVVADYTILGGARAKIRISIITKELGRMLVYTFVPVKFLIQQLRSQEEFFFILSKSGDFWNLESIRKHDPLQGVEKKIIPHYRPLGKLNTTFFKNVFSRLLPHHYVLDLKGLVTPKLGIPNTISLLGIHAPKNPEDYRASLNRFYLLQAYLNLATLKYFGITEQSAEGKPANITSEITDRVITSHPYTLSVTQKTLIVHYLGLLTSVDKSSLIKNY